MTPGSWCDTWDGLARSGGNIEMSRKFHDRPRCRPSICARLAPCTGAWAAKGQSAARESWGAGLRTALWEDFVDAIAAFMANTKESSPVEGTLPGCSGGTGQGPPYRGQCGLDRAQV